LSSHGSTDHADRTREEFNQLITKVLFPQFAPLLCFQQREPTLEFGRRHQQVGPGVKQRPVAHRVSL
jgi:hypothetical protein